MTLTEILCGMILSLVAVLMWGVYLHYNCEVPIHAYGVCLTEIETLPMRITQ